MKFQKNKPGMENRRRFKGYPLITLVVSLVAMVATFFIATSDLADSAKINGFFTVIAAFLFICVVMYFRQSKKNRVTDKTAGATDETIDRGLDALDEATDFFMGTLRPADAFRLVSSRVRDLIPFQTIVLFLLNDSRDEIVSVHAEGPGAENQIGQVLNLNEALVGQAYSTREVEIDGYMMLDSEQEFGSAVAIPLLHGENVFGVIQLFFTEDFDLTDASVSLLEGIGSRVAPLMLGSIAYERTQANALTDITTDLPNERSFYLVLENHVAESQRKRDERPLTVLAIDIKNFQELNCTFGHVAGDKVLNFVARSIKDSLRNMDFISRALNDEFLVILPTANKEISSDIIARIHTGFFGRKLAINETQAIEVELNIGWAAFGTDGETPGQLLSLAQLRKEQSKSSMPNKVLWFPQELVN